MIALATDLAILENVIVWMALKGMTAQKVYAPFFALVMVHMQVEFATALKVGKGQSVIFLHMIVNPLTALVVVNVWLDNVIAKLVGKDLSVMKRTASTPPAVDTGHVSVVVACVALAGAAQPARSETRAFSDACLPALKEEYTT